MSIIALNVTHLIHQLKQFSPLAARIKQKEDPMVYVVCKKPNLSVLKDRSRAITPVFSKPCHCQKPVGKSESSREQLLVGLNLAFTCLVSTTY